MSLKIVRGARSVKASAPRVQAPPSARELMFQCEACGKRAFVKLPYQPTPAQRQRVISEALAEHRRIACTAAPEDGRTFRIWYPRS